MARVFQEDTARGRPRGAGGPEGAGAVRAHEVWPRLAPWPGVAGKNQDPISILGPLFIFICF